MNFRGETLDNLHIGDVNITEDLTVDGNHIVAGDIEVTQIEVENINLKPPNTSINFTGDINLNDNKILNTTEITSTSQVNMPQPLKYAVLMVIHYY
jgi:hypothetical protein